MCDICKMREQRFSLIALFLALSLISTPTQAAVKPGTSCSKIKSVFISDKTKFTCIKSGNKLVWNKGSKLQKVTPIQSPQPIAAKESATASLPELQQEFKISIYKGSSGGDENESLLKSDELPPNFTLGTTPNNLKLWIYDPENRSRALGAPGVFFQKSGGEWYFIAAASSDGIFTTDLPPGRYTFDVVEPNGDQKKYARGRYSLIVNPDKTTKIEGFAPNSSGHYSVTVNLKNRRENEIMAFQDDSICKMRDQSGSSTGSNAFPRARGRLTNEGSIRALIIPVSFSNLTSSSEPFKIYRSMAEGTHKFFYKQSQGRVSFEFTTFKNFLNLNIPVETFNLGSYNRGDPGGLFKAGLTVADPVVDFSQFDVVYVLPPPNVSGNQIAYGPAFPNSWDGSDFFTQDGRVMNGSVGGADAWQKLEGADWKWMAHETGHLFGLFDWYTLDNRNPYGPWDIMSLNWSNKAIELNAWNRYISGWLDDSQIRCFDKNTLTIAPIEIVIEVIGIDSRKVKSTMVKLSESKILVFEARATAGLDYLPMDESGLLVYTVDVSIDSIKGVAVTHSRLGGGRALADAPLRAGESIFVDGIKVSVSSFDGKELIFTLNR